MRLGSPEEMFYLLSFRNSFIEECIVTIFVSRNDETTERKWAPSASCLLFLSAGPAEVRPSDPFNLTNWRGPVLFCRDKTWRKVWVNSIVHTRFCRNNLWPVIDADWLWYSAAAWFSRFFQVFLSHSFSLPLPFPPHPSLAPPPAFPLLSLLLHSLIFLSHSSPPAPARIQPHSWAEMWCPFVC